MTKIITLENGNILKTPSPYYLFPRSSIYKTRYRLANSVGIIDCGYRGNLMAAMDCHRDNIGLPEKKEIQSKGSQQMPARTIHLFKAIDRMLELKGNAIAVR